MVCIDTLCTTGITLCRLSIAYKLYMFNLENEKFIVLAVNLFAYCQHKTILNTVLIKLQNQIR